MLVHAVECCSIDYSTSGAGVWSDYARNDSEKHQSHRRSHDEGEMDQLHIFLCCLNVVVKKVVKAQD